MLKGLQLAHYVHLNFFGWPSLKGSSRIRNDLKSRIRVQTSAFRIPNTGVISILGPDSLNSDPEN
jgi:hypothetical protein